jgi:hypothetical protein
MAGDQDFKRVNKTGYTINEVYMGPLSASTWGNDIMGTGTFRRRSRWNSQTRRLRR